MFTKSPLTSINVQQVMSPNKPNNLNDEWPKLDSKFVGTWLLAMKVKFERAGMGHVLQ